jgi:hypothetical protein
MWTMLELTKASQVANAELLVNAELIGPNPIEAAVDRGHDFDDGIINKKIADQVHMHQQVRCGLCWN